MPPPLLKPSPLSERALERELELELELELESKLLELLDAQLNRPPEEALLLLLLLLLPLRVVLKKDAETAVAVALR